MTNFILRHRIAWYGFGIGLSTSCVFLLAYKLTANFIVASVSVLLLAVVAFVLIYHYELSKLRPHLLIVFSGISFEGLAILLTLPYPKLALPPVATFFMTYIAIFITTVLLIVSLYIAFAFMQKAAR